MILYSNIHSIQKRTIRAALSALVVEEEKGWCIYQTLSTNLIGSDYTSNDTSVSGQPGLTSPPLSPHSCFIRGNIHASDDSRLHKHLIQFYIHAFFKSSFTLHSSLYSRFLHYISSFTFMLHSSLHLHFIQVYIQTSFKSTFTLHSSLHSNFIH